MLSRRTLLLGGGAATVAVAAGGVGVWEGALPGRVFLQAELGLNGEDGVVPDVATGPVESGSFVSQARLGATVRWHLLLPPGTTVDADLPLVVALHGLGWEVDSFLPGDLGVPELLAQAVADGVPPFAIVVPDGGDTYWHERPSGEDAGAMVVDELLPLMAERGLRATPTDRIGLIGWSMGGYGALRLAGLLGSERVAAVAVAGPALWSDADEASRSGFDDADEYRAFTVFGHQDDLAGIEVSIDCGTGDPFYRSVEDYVDGFPGDADVRSSFEPGAHDRGFWRRVMPAQLELLGRALASET
ncbi:esterase family protein [Nocardioides sp.]|uniref:alpha/beta hydrolase n=1 Tax=Nocardioides sp. TaxID=35761 RepID=UPI0027266147|nr:alpha/beta hydrolase-fold protein [Nocardioides sp.]MDO9454489.1 alpha/beta hydrolase-fold protein [Nocardioides sp.]